jgi:hypothetical protein
MTAATAIRRQAGCAPLSVRFFDDVASVTYMFLQSDEICLLGQSLPPEGGPLRQADEASNRAKTIVEHRPDDG